MSDKRVDTIYPPRCLGKSVAMSHHALSTSVRELDALRAENAELKRLITHMVEAIGKGAVDSEEIVPVPGDGPPYRFHEEWVHYARSALSTKGGEDD